MSDKAQFTALDAENTETVITELVDIKDIDKLKAKYGEVYQIDITVDEDDENEGNTFRYYFRNPTTASFNRYLKTASKSMAKSTEAFTNDNIVEEQRAEFTAKSQKYPGLPMNCGSKLLSALGLGDNINFRKL